MVDLDWRKWTPAQYRASMLASKEARDAYNRDVAALDACDICVLVLPAGPSSNWELGRAGGKGKRCVVAQFAPYTPELMYYDHEIVVNERELMWSVESFRRLSLAKRGC